MFYWKQLVQMLFVEISFFSSVLQQSIIAIMKFEWHYMFITAYKNVNEVHKMTT